MGVASCRSIHLQVKTMKVVHPNLILTISAGRMSLTRAETHEIIMRHSTSR
jgi:hypothetical protein